MAQSSDDDAAHRPRKPGDHMASKLDAFRSGPLQALARDIMIVTSTPAEASVLVSMLRAVFGRQFNARHLQAMGNTLEEAARKAPKLILLREDIDPGSIAGESVVKLVAAGFTCPIVVICEHLTVGDAVRLRQAGALDVIERDDLNSVRLSQALARAVAGGQDPPTIRIAALC